MAQAPSPNPTTRVCWSIKSWCNDTDLSLSFVRELISTRQVDSIKVGNKRLIVTSPSAFIASQRGSAA